jgi:hypothetical protein
MGIGMNTVAGFVGGALLAGALTFAGPAAAATTDFNGGRAWNAESMQRDATASASPAAAPIDLTAVTSYSLGW